MPRIKIEVVEDALKKTMGLQTQAAKMLGITPSAISHRIKRSPRLQRLIRDIQEEWLDTAEYELSKKMRSGDLGALCFYLKCKGKDRGFVERREITGKDGGALEMKMSLTDRLKDLHRKGKLKDVEPG
jgi:hypothetical protein